MIKTLKFIEPLPEMILKGEKDTTWRINDDKDLQKGDILSLIDSDRNEFGKAEIQWVKETTFKHLREEDTQGHEKFKTIDEMLTTYSGYYNTTVTLDTPIKIIKFKLIS